MNTSAENIAVLVCTTVLILGLFILSGSFFAFFGLALMLFYKG